MAPTSSTGPRTKAGKIRSSLNALRHGLAAIDRRQQAPPVAVERLAQAICGDEHDGALLGAARAIAEHAFVLAAIRQQKIIVIERLKEATAIALRKGDNSFTLGKARFLQAWLDHREIQKLVPQVMKKFELQGPPVVLDGDLVPIQIKALLEEEQPTDEEQARALGLARKELKHQERNEYEAQEEAVPDLIRLERYERRAWSRQKRAIQQFVLIKFNCAMAAARRMPTT
jgi:hypothetical protein